MFFPTTTVSVFRTDGTQADATSPRGDPIDEPWDDTPIATGIPFSIKETARKVFIQETQTRMTVRDYKGRCDPLPIVVVVDDEPVILDGIKPGDRLLDEVTGFRFIVDESTLKGNGLVGEPVNSFDLRVFK